MQTLHKQVNVYFFLKRMIQSSIWTSPIAIVMGGVWLAGCQDSIAPGVDKIHDTAQSVSEATESKAPISRPAAHDSAFKDSSEVEEISFDDINLQMQADVKFRPFMLTDRAKQLDGRRVRLTGFIFGGVAQSRGIKEFILLRNRECKFGPGGQADHLVQIYLLDNVTTNYTDKAVAVEGVLKIKPFEGADGFTWSVYELAGIDVKARKR